eukprot:14456352-Alexandrium_andersonii.AAC.1
MAESGCVGSVDPLGADRTRGGRRCEDLPLSAEFAVLAYFAFPAYRPSGAVPVALAHADTHAALACARSLPSLR